MGFDPRQVEAMTLWEFIACAEGFRQIHEGAGAPPEMDDDRLAELGIVGFT